VTSPYITNTEADRTAMLADIGVGSVEGFFRDIPEKFRHPHLKLPSALSEFELRRELSRLASCNANVGDFACFLGAGFYQHFTPAVVDHIVSRSEFYTAYTPYQAEVSQGTLQAGYEYQSMVCQLTGMEVSNLGMYDGSTAAAEATMMACRLTKRHRISVLHTVNPRYCDVIKTYADGKDIPVEKLQSDLSQLPLDCACLVVQQPNFFGNLIDIKEWADKASAAGALLIVIANPISLGMLTPPGNYGADIVVAEGQALGIPLSFGGPGLGIFACRKEYLRQMPGRIVSKTRDAVGTPGYVLTLQTREQHIRRERATSNICSNENLVMLAAVVYLAAMGKEGLRRVAELCYHKAHYTAKAINCLSGYSLVSTDSFFNEFLVRCPASPRRINGILLEAGIIGGLDLSHLVKNSMLFCVTEVNTKEQIDLLIDVLGKV
jgi:glycine dehydrogenase subunit 1